MSVRSHKLALTLKVLRNLKHLCTQFKSKYATSTINFYNKSKRKILQIGSFFLFAHFLVVNSISSGSLRSSNPSSDSAFCCNLPSGQVISTYKGVAPSLYSRARRIGGAAATDHTIDFLNALKTTPGSLQHNKSSAKAQNSSLMYNGFWWTGTH